MSVRAVRLFVAAYILVFLLATVWPGALLFNRVEPLILGLPFNLFFIALLAGVSSLFPFSAPLFLRFFPFPFSSLFLC
ncbi:MAG: hypothetical protein AAGF15_10970, partial [Pseudomonadota bacterium]